LLAAVESVRDVVAANVDVTEQGRTLAPAVVEAFRESGLFTLKLPEVLGGAEADPVVQMDVIEAVAMIDPSAAWSMFIGSAVTGGVSANASDELLEVLFEGDRFPCMAGTLKPDGLATPVEGGFRVTGRWGWGSGICHADYVSALVLCPDLGTMIRCVVPIADVTVHDNWHVMGMKGTGSCDYELDDVFVPDLFASDLMKTPQRRGGQLYRLGLPGYVINEHAIFALAIARLALNTASDLAIEKKRGYGAGTTIADREVFQRAVATGDLRLKACRAYAVDVLERLFEAAADGLPDPHIQGEARAMATFCTDEAIAVTGELFRHGGGTAVFLGSVLERCLRDLYTVQSHFVVNDSSYEVYGQQLLGLIEDSPLR
jgi:alkylation response protein AidB-like acyl-CoA dehydrogenase